ncbi:MAG: hypothetical protein H6950_06290 [Zoogloeaceae bacterium]|nr:hypothetical protein [Zoogloeaceae bacterium]
MRLLRLSLLPLLMACAGAHAFEGGRFECGDLENPVGPYDYRKDKSLLSNVEQNHFNDNVRLLRKGQSASIAGDLDYLLRAYPNHPGGLDAIGRLGRRAKSEKLYGANYKVTCYFDRAVRLAPDDPTVRVLFAQHLWMTGNRVLAVEQIEAAETLGADDANTLYNIGIMKFEIGDKKAAKKYAIRAYDLGFPLPGLKNKLRRAGLWD